MKGSQALQSESERDAIDLRSVTQHCYIARSPSITI